MVNLFKTQRGFGMLQAMIFAGIIAAGALVATRVINDLKLTQRGSATKDELEVLHRSVEAALQDSYNCTATRRGLIDGLSPSRVILADSDNSTAQLADNPVMIQVGEVYGGNSVKVDSIVFTSANPLWAASNDQQVIVTYSRLKSDAANRLGQGYGGKDVRRVIPITVINGDVNDTPGSGEERCYADPKTGANYYSSGSTQKFCQSLGSFMFWDPFQRKCIRQNHVCPADQAFMGVDAYGFIICKNLKDAMNASNLFDTTAPTSCPGRTQLQLVVVGGKIRIQCIAGGTANLAWTPLTHDFGTVAVGGISPDQVFTLTNSGTASTSGCSQATITDTTNFTLALSSICGTNDIPPGGICTVKVAARPTTAGIKTTTLSRTCTVGGTASTILNQIIVNGGTGACQGQGDDSSLFTLGTVSAPSCSSGCICTSPFPYVKRDYVINTAKFKVGNRYYLGIGQSWTAVAVAGDTPQTVLNRLASNINTANMVSTGACSTSSAALATVIPPNIIQVRQQFQHSPAPASSYSCNIATQAECIATPNCTWDTTSANVCKGFYYLKPQGTCNGTYSVMQCVYNGFTSGGSDAGCDFGYPDQTSCQTLAANMQGCSWGSMSQTCYGSDSASCTANAGCSWSAKPSSHETCTSTWIGQATCQANSPACTWGPP